MPFHLKMTGTSSTDDARVKVPSFQKVLFFSYNMKYSKEMPSICIFVCMKMFLTAVIKDEHTSHYYSSLEIEKNNAKYRQIDFLRFIF